MEIRIGPLHVRRSILRKAPPAQVWHEFTSFERLGADAADNLQGYEDGWDIKRSKALREIVER